MGNTNNNETNKKEDEEDDDGFIKIRHVEGKKNEEIKNDIDSEGSSSENNGGSNSGSSSSRSGGNRGGDISGDEEELNEETKAGDNEGVFRSKGLFEDGLRNILFSENYFKNFFSLNDIKKFGFIGKNECSNNNELKNVNYDSSINVKHGRHMNELIIYNNQYMINLLNDTTKSKIEIANFISFYFCFLSMMKNEIPSVPNARKEQEDFSTISYIYQKVKNSRNYISTHDIETCIKNYLYHIDRKYYPILNNQIDEDNRDEINTMDDRSTGSFQYSNKEYEKKRVIIDKNMVQQSLQKFNILKELFRPYKNLTKFMSETDRGHIHEDGGYFLFPPKRRIVHRIKIWDDKITLKPRTSMNKKLDETFYMYDCSLLRGVRRRRSSGKGSGKRIIKDSVKRTGTHSGKYNCKYSSKCSYAHSGHLLDDTATEALGKSNLTKSFDERNITNEEEVTDNMSIKKEVNKIKSYRSYSVYIRKTLSKVFYKSDMNKSGAVSKNSMINKNCITSKNNLLLGHHKEPNGRMNLGISFSAAGLLIPYHLGVSSLLIEKNILNMHTNISGSSAGCICACLLGIGLNIDKCIFLAENIISNVYKKGSYQKLQSVLNLELNKYLYADSYNYLNTRIGNVFVGITQILPYYKKLNVNKFNDDEDLINAIIASCNIPMYVSNNVFVNFRNKKCIDGIFSTKKKDFGCISTKTERMIRVIPFDFHYIGMENKNNGVISPHLIKYNHIIFLFLCIKNLFHKFINNIWVEKDYLFLLRNLKQILDKKIFDYYTFVKRYFFFLRSSDIVTDEQKVGNRKNIIDLINHIRNKLNTLNYMNINSLEIDLFLKLNNEIFLQLNNKYDNNVLKFCNFSVTLINVMGKYFFENFDGSSLDKIVLHFLRSNPGNNDAACNDGNGGAERNIGGGVGGCNDSNSGANIHDARINDFIREENHENIFEMVFQFLKKNGFLKVDKYIYFNPQLKDDIIIYFFKEIFFNENILKAKRKALKRNIPLMIEVLKVIFFNEHVKRRIFKLLIFAVNCNEKKLDYYTRDDITSSPIYGGKNMSMLFFENINDIKVINHYLKYNHIYKNFIYIIYEINTVNNKVGKVSKYNYYNYMNLNMDDVNDMYLFLYVYLYSILNYKILFALINIEQRESFLKVGVNTYPRSLHARVGGGISLRPDNGTSKKSTTDHGTDNNAIVNSGTPHFIQRYRENNLLNSFDPSYNLMNKAESSGLIKRFSGLWLRRKIKLNLSFLEINNKFELNFFKGNNNEIERDDNLNLNYDGKYSIEMDNDMDIKNIKKSASYTDKFLLEDDEEREETNKVRNTISFGSEEVTLGGKYCKQVDHNETGNSFNTGSSFIFKNLKKTWKDDFFKCPIRKVENIIERINENDYSIYTNCFCTFENLLIFNYGCAFIGKIDEYIMMNRSKIFEMNKKNKKEIFFLLHQLYLYYRNILFLLKFVFGINFCEKTQYKYLRKRRRRKKKRWEEKGAEEKVRDKKEVQEEEAEEKEGERKKKSTRKDERNEDKEESDESGVSTKEGPKSGALKNSTSPVGNKKFSSIVEDIFGDRTFERSDMDVNNSKKFVGKNENTCVDLISSQYFTLWRSYSDSRSKEKENISNEEKNKKMKKRRNNLVGRSSLTILEEESTNERRKNFALGSNNDFVEEIKTNISEVLYDNCQTYFVKNSFSMRKLIKIGFKGANEKDVKKLYDLGRSDAYLWLYIEYLNVGMYIYKKIYIIYLKLISAFESLIYITNLNKKKKKYDVENMLGLIGNFVIYVNGQPFNIFKLCNFVFSCYSYTYKSNSTEFFFSNNGLRKKTKWNYFNNSNFKANKRNDWKNSTIPNEQKDLENFSCTVKAEKKGDKKEEKGKTYEALYSYRQGGQGDNKYERSVHNKYEGNCSVTYNARGNLEQVHLNAPSSVRKKKEKKSLNDSKSKNLHGNKSRVLKKGERNHPRKEEKSKRRNPFIKSTNTKRKFYRSISLPLNIKRTILRMNRLKNKISLNKNIIDGINSEILKGTPYEHIYTHTNFWLYSSSDEGDMMNSYCNGLYVNNTDNTNKQFDSIFDEMSDDLDGFSKLSILFKNFRNMDNGLGLSGYFGF
ncbi:conserved Plasmodium protein, unknown function [Plasmodium malariae]|uniref:PNPLA domain-containing protein n=1 Tax=Plasmodium malariae TaxID=5858 RepID=A0A1A8VRC0_PLAMA|nr:conserved Plasmodium protein, unknown function [Plasmodium malariae]SBS82219.1 conserved Plasmodium protein, unknown function [Plasmodium malariae]SBT86443.1 conserved Plasmodium protein, unknown function [Plasmodium malariae]